MTKTQINKNCPSCGTVFDTLDRRKIYCSNGCKQDAYRSRNGIVTPAFLQPKGILQPIERKRAIVKKVSNPELVELKSQIKKLEASLAHYEFQTQEYQEKEADILNQDDELIANLVAGALAAGIILLVAIGTKELLEKAKDKKSKDRIKMIAALVGITTAGLTAALVHSRISEKRKRSKVKKLAKLKQDTEETSLLALQASAELAALKSQTVFLPEYIEQSELKTYYEQRLGDSDQTTTLSQLHDTLFDTMSLSQRFTNLIGTPERGFAMAVHGSPGQGKSTFTIDFSKDLAEHGNKVLFVSAEEGLSQSLQKKFKDYNSPNIELSSLRTLTGIKNLLKKGQYDAIILDSVQQIRISAEQLTKLRESHPKTCFVYILQATKGGSFKGDNSYAHDADIIIKLDSYQPIREKSRFV